MSLPSQYRRLPEKTVQLEDGGYIRLAVPKYKDKIEFMYSSLIENSTSQYIEHRMDIMKILIEANPKNATLKDIKIDLEKAGIPFEAYIEYKKELDIKTQEEMLMYIAECKDGNGESFTIDSLDELDTIFPDIKSKLTDAYFELINDRMSIDEKNLKCGGKAKTKKSKN